MWTLLLLLLEAAFLASPWPLVVAGLGVVYSEGLARWSEGQDMSHRFGDDWTRYRREVKAWRFRWRPATAAPCELWVDLGCGPCRSVGGWFQRRRVTGLVLRDAREWTGTPLRRVTWRDPGSGRTEAGVAAIAMALQHLQLGWAALGLGVIAQR